MFWHFFRLVIFSLIFVVIFSRRIKNKISVISTLSITIAMIAANLVWFEYRRFLLPHIENVIGRIPDKAIAVFFNAIGTAATFVFLILLLKALGKIVYGSYEKNAYSAVLERLRGALPVVLERVADIISNAEIIDVIRDLLAPRKRCESLKKQTGSAIVFKFSRILI